MSKQSSARPITVFPLVLWAGAAGGCHGPDVIPESRDPPGAERVRWEGPDGSVSALRSGDPAGRRVVFVHGTPGEATNWSPYLEAPFDGVEFLALDRPGFGASEPEGAVPWLARQAAALEPVLLSRRGDLPLLVGHSLGGPIVLRAAVDYPDRVGGLVIVSGNVDPELEELHWYNHLARWLEPVLPRELVNSNDELFPHRGELEDLFPRIAGIRCPVAIVHGTEDDLVPFANAKALRAALAPEVPLRFVRLKGEDHFLLWTRPQAVRDALRWLLEGFPASELP